MDDVHTLLKRSYIALVHGVIHHPDACLEANSVIEDITAYCMENLSADTGPADQP